MLKVAKKHGMFRIVEKGSGKVAIDKVTKEPLDCGGFFIFEPAADLALSLNLEQKRVKPKWSR